MSINRRDFLKAATAAGCLGAFSSVSGLAFAQTGSAQPLLVTLFLRGGADGLALAAPANDPDYIAARPPEMRVVDSGDRAGLPLDRGLGTGLDFRLHPDAQPLADLYRAGRLSVLHAVGLSDGTRSHFVAQDLIERGLSDEAKISNLSTGWLARAVAAAPITPGNRLAAYSASSATDQALHGLPSVLATPDISSGLGVPWGAPMAQALRGMAAGGTSPAHRATLAALDTLETVDRGMPRDPQGRVLAYVPGAGATYANAGELSRTLASVARLAKMEAGLRAACVDHGGWDTHEGQPGRFANQVRQLSAGLSAFHADMAAANRPVVVLVMTEFGRRVRANKSMGTDHGHGACWLALGDGIAGGRMLGRWPGLQTQQLDQGVDLAVTTDYRAILADTLGMCGLTADLPGWQPVAPLGLGQGT